MEEGIALENVDSIDLTNPATAAAMQKATTTTTAAAAAAAIVPDSQHHQQQQQQILIQTQQDMIEDDGERRVPTSTGSNGTGNGSRKNREIRELLKESSSVVVGHPEEPVLTYYKCDVCFAEPIITRWHCLDCTDFDTCENCYQSHSHDRGHRMKYIFSTPKSIAGTDVGVPDSSSALGTVAVPAMTSTATPSLGIAIPSGESGDESNGGIRQQHVRGIPRTTGATNAIAGAASTTASSQQPTSGNANGSGAGRRRNQPIAVRSPNTAMDDMNEILEGCEIGSIPPSNMSTNLAVSFLHYYDCGLDALKQEYSAAAAAASSPRQENMLGRTYSTKFQPASQTPKSQLSENRADLQFICLSGMLLAGITLPVAGRSKKYRPAWTVPSADTPTPTLSNYAPLTDRLVANLMALLSQLELYDTYSWFSDPVPSTVPGYYEVIQRPSDLGSTRDRLLRGDFHPPLESSDRPQDVIIVVLRRFRRCVRRIWHNAVSFNPKGHPIHEAAHTLSQLFQQQMEILCARMCVDFAQVTSNPAGLRPDSPPPQQKIDESHAAAGMMAAANADVDESRNDRKRSRVASDSTSQQQQSSKAPRQAVQSTRPPFSSTLTTTAASRSSVPTVTSAAASLPIHPTPTSSQPVAVTTPAQVSVSLLRHENLERDHLALANEVYSLRQQLNTMKTKLDSVVSALRGVSRNLN